MKKQFNEWFYKKKENILKEQADDPQAVSVQK